MPTVIVRLVVEDFATWHAEYERMHQYRADCGERGHQLFRDADDPDTVVVIFTWDSIDNAEAYFNGAELSKSVRRARGRGRPQVTYLTRHTTEVVSWGL